MYYTFTTLSNSAIGKGFGLYQRHRNVLEARLCLSILVGLDVVLRLREDRCDVVRHILRRRVDDDVVEHLQNGKHIVVGDRYIGVDAALRGLLAHARIAGIEERQRDDYGQTSEAAT